MSVEQAGIIDFASVDTASNEMWLTIFDHLPWHQDEGEHLMLVQEKLNRYLAFIESGEIDEKIPQATGRRIVINWVGKYRLSDQALKFYNLCEAAIQDAGFGLRFELVEPALLN